MKAVIQDRYGSADILEFRDIDRPVPTADEVLVRVHAASVNAYDWHLMHGDPVIGRTMMGFRRPKAPVRGRDFAGVVEEAGSGVTGLKPGDEVYGEADGAFAEYVCARADNVGPKPANLTFEQAAAIPLAGNTALIGLRDVARVQPGQTLLVNGASGGVGTFAVQLGKAYGTEVTAVCSTRNVDMVRSLGADRIIDYTQEDFTRGEARYDVVLDLVGNHSLGSSGVCSTPSGRSSCPAAGCTRAAASSDRWGCSSSGGWWLRSHGTTGCWRSPHGRAGRTSRRCGSWPSPGRSLRSSSGRTR